MSKDPETEAIVREFVRLTGPRGADMSDGEVVEEMAVLDLKISRERVRQIRAGEWELVQASTRRTLRAYIEWKRATSTTGRALEIGTKGLPGPTGTTEEEAS
jgi:hypothetical protein